MPGTFLVFALYWGLVYDGGSVRVLECLTHGANFGVMLIDLILSRQSFRLLHAIYFLAFALLFILWTVIFHVSELDRPCACSEDDDSPSQFGCQEAGDDYKADECNYVYSSLNWAGATMGKTSVLVAIIILVVIPLVVVGFHAFVLFLRAYIVPRAFPNQELQRRDTMVAFESAGYCGALAYEMQWTHFKPTTHDWVSFFQSCHFSGLNLRENCLILIRTRCSYYCVILGIADSTYVLIRFGLAVTMAAIMFWSIASSLSALWLIYLTIWTLIIEILYLSSAACVTFQANKSGKPVDRAARQQNVIEIAMAPQYQ